MKKVLLTNFQQMRVLTPEVIMKQDIIMKPLNGDSTTSLPKINNGRVHMQANQTNVITDTYMQRKSYQSTYEDIFKLLMTLPDKALQQRVIDAINGRSDKSAPISNTNQCKHCCKKPRKLSASTQTETLETKETTDKPPVNEFEKQTDVKSVKKEEETVKVENTSEKGVKGPRKRGRKRNTCVPQVVKRSAAQMALQEREDKQLTPLPPLKKKKLETATPSPVASPNVGQRRESTTSNYSYLDNFNLPDLADGIADFVNNDIQCTIMKTMANEVVCAGIISEEGLLPIHDAILNNDVQHVQRQVFVWTKIMKNTDFNELISADGEDCLQLALTNDCEPEIVKIFLNAGLLPNHIYDDSNTALHIAILNNVHLESIQELMLQIDLNLLLQTNDDGYTPLHLAVRHNRYKMAEIICDTIDERQLGSAVYRRELDEAEETTADMSGRSPEDRDQKQFGKFYERACDRLEQNRAKLLRRQLKHEVLNAPEARAGNACLFYAVEGELEHFCYFFLAHLSNPDEENLGGHSPKSFLYEYARVLRINLKISRIMDKVHFILNGV